MKTSKSWWLPSFAIAAAVACGSEFQTGGDGQGGSSSSGGSSAQGGKASGGSKGSGGASSGGGSNSGGSSNGEGGTVIGTTGGFSSVGGTQGTGGDIVPPGAGGSSDAGAGGGEPERDCSALLEDYYSKVESARECQLDSPDVECSTEYTLSDPCGCSVPVNGLSSAYEDAKKLWEQIQNQNCSIQLCDGFCVTGTSVQCTGEPTASASCQWHL